MIHLEKKICLNCKKEFHRRTKLGKKEWIKRKYCSMSCKFEHFSPSKETRQRISFSTSLEKHPQWKSGCIKRNSVLKRLILRNGFKIDFCWNCEKKFNSTDKVHVHHRDKNRKNNNLSNLMIVCVPCHKRLDGYGFYTDLARKENVAISTIWARFDRQINPEKYKIISRKNYLKYKSLKIQKNKGVA